MSGDKKHHQPVISGPSTLSVSTSPNMQPVGMVKSSGSQGSLMVGVGQANGTSPLVASSTTSPLVSRKPSFTETSTYRTTDYKFDEYEEMFFSKAVINDAVKISVIPDLLSVASEKRQTYITQSNSPEEDKLPKGIQESMAVFNQHWTVISRDVLPTSTNTPFKKIESQPYLNVYPQGEVDSGSPEASVKDLNLELMNSANGYTPDHKVLDQMKSAQRVPLFKTIPPCEDDLSSIEPPKIGKPIQDPVGFQFTVECSDFKPNLGNFEPFFGRMFLFDDRASDLKSGIISEEFHFDLGLNLDIIPKTSDLEGPTKIKKALFNVAQRSNSIHLIVCFDKVILGDPEEKTKPYFNPHGLKPKELAKFTEEIREGVSRLGHFKQSFVWGCVDLFDSNQQFLFNPNSAFNEVEYKVGNIVKVKGDLLNFVTKEKKSTKDSLFDCTIKIQQVSSFSSINPSTGQEIYTYNENLVGRIDHLLRPKKSKDLGASANGHPMVKEILQFDYQPVEKDQYGKDTKEAFLNYSNLLYLYPKSVNLTNYKSDKGSSARNIFLEVKLLEDDTNINNPGLKNIHGTCQTPILTRKFCTQVHYHNRKPKFADEIKINLPPNLTANHHLLVTFYHLGCRQSKKSDRPEVPLGYCAIRLFENDQIICDNKYKKPVATVFPPKYLAEEAKDPKDPSNLKMWVDNKKPVFSFRTRVISSTYPQDPVLAFILRNGIECDHNTLNDNIKRIPEVGSKLKSQYFPALMRVLFKCITNLTTEIANNAFSAILNLCDSVSEDQLSSYITYIFSNAACTVTFYDSLIQTWNRVLESGDAQQVTLSIQYSWFLFGLIKKSMVLEIDVKAVLKSGRNRTGRFSDEFLNRLRFLFDQLLVQLKLNYKSQLSKYKLFIVYVGHFVNDLMDILNRGFVFKLIFHYVTGLDSSNTVMELMEIKSRFFRVLAMNDAFIALNLPMPFPFPSTAQEIYATFYKKHFLVGLLLQEVSTSITAREREMRSNSVQSLREIMGRFDISANYNTPAMRERIATLYFPYILILVDNYAAIIKFEQEELKLWLICFVYVVKNLINTSIITDWWKKETLARKTNFFNLLNKSVQLFDYGSDHFGMFGINGLKAKTVKDSKEMNGSTGHSKTESSTTNPESLVGSDSPSRKYKTKGPTVVQTAKQSPGGNKITPERAKEQIEQNIYNSVSSVNKSERTYSMSSPSNVNLANGATQGTLNGSGSAPMSNSTHSTMTNSSGSVTNTPTMSSSGTGISNSIPSSPNPGYRSMMFSKSTLSFDLITPMLENLSHEVSLTALNCIVVYIRNNKDDLLKSGGFSTLEMMFRSIIAILTQEQSNLIIRLCFSTLASMINEFKTVLFKLNNSICENLTQIVFQYTYSLLPANRQYATTLVFVMILNNLKEVGNFSRMKLQSTVAVSKILNYMTMKPNIEKMPKDFFQYLYASLNSITNFVKSQCKEIPLKPSTKRPSVGGTGKIPSIAQQIDDFKSRLDGVIHNNQNMLKFSYDPEMSADLYYNLANTFIESPDLRITWLKSYSSFLKEKKNYEEAAQVNIIAGALILNYLKLLGRYPHNIEVNFSIVSQNINTELVMPDANALAEVEDEICKIEDFTEAGFINLLRDAIYQLKVGSFFESCADTYRLLLPTYQRIRDWQKQMDCYTELQVLCKLIINENTASQRIFSNYYRVFFYCEKLLPELHEKEFVYKELNFVRLSDISERLKNQYGEKFKSEVGKDVSFVHLLPNNKPIDKATLNPEHFYIQIISLEPYLLPEELAERKTPFEQNTNLNQFFYEIPFTKNSPKLSEKIEEQWKKKVLITTKSYFPYLKKRVPITNKKEIELTPIESSIELLQKKTNNLLAELNTSAPNTKTLQINLQGCLLLQVNAGPLSICETFLSSASFSKFNADHVSELAGVVKKFTNTLGFALKLNKELSKNDSPELIEQLDIGYKSFREAVSNYVQFGADEIEN